VGKFGVDSRGCDKGVWVLGDEWGIDGIIGGVG
jgi:hypothetical protein